MVSVFATEYNILPTGHTFILAEEGLSLPLPPYIYLFQSLPPPLSLGHLRHDRSFSQKPLARLLIFEVFEHLDGHL